jgi:hypothetical protein
MALAACSILAACASAPISVSSRFDATTEATPAHTAITRAAERFETVCLERGWIADTGSMDTAMRWMGRLTGQASGEEGSEDAVARYLRVNETTLAAAGLPVRLQADLLLAVDLTGEVEEAARMLIAAGGGNSRAALTASLGDVETAMTRGRDALALFDRLITALPEESDAGLADGRDRLAGRIEDLRDRADELVRLRRQFRNNSALS